MQFVRPACTQGRGDSDANQAFEDANAISVVAPARTEAFEQIVVHVRVRLKLPPAPPANTPALAGDPFDRIDLLHVWKSSQSSLLLTMPLTLGNFLGVPDAKKRFKRIDKPLLVHGRTTSQELAHVFESLSNEIRARSLGAGDTVFVVIETHLIKRGPRAYSSSVPTPIKLKF